MNETYFSNCRTVAEVKAEYRRLAKQHHPDAGGCEETMKAVNAAYHATLRRMDGQETTRRKDEKTSVAA